MLNKENDILKPYALCDVKYSMGPSLNLAINAIINPTHIFVSNF